MDKNHSQNRGWTEFAKIVVAFFMTAYSTMIIWQHTLITILHESDFTNKPWQITITWLLVQTGAIMILQRYLKTTWLKVSLFTLGSVYGLLCHFMAIPEISSLIGSPVLSFMATSMSATLMWTAVLALRFLLGFKPINNSETTQKETE